jgi:hypothetical protein
MVPVEPLWEVFTPGVIANLPQLERRRGTGIAKPDAR